MYVDYLLLFLQWHHTKITPNAEYAEWILKKVCAYQDIWNWNACANSEYQATSSIICLELRQATDNLDYYNKGGFGPDKLQLSKSDQCYCYAILVYSTKKVISFVMYLIESFFNQFRVVFHISCLTIYSLFSCLTPLVGCHVPTQVYSERLTG